MSKATVDHILFRCFSNMNNSGNLTVYKFVLKKYISYFSYI